MTSARPICRGQRGDRRPSETAETVVVRLITQRRPAGTSAYLRRSWAYLTLGEEGRSVTDGVRSNEVVGERLARALEAKR